MPLMNPEEAKVRKINFVDQGQYGHPAPDPLLLLVKAAINWSKFHDFPLLAGGEIEDEEEDDLSRAAEADFLEWQENARKEITAAEVVGKTILFPGNTGVVDNGMSFMKQKPPGII